MKTIIIYYY